MKTLLLTTVLWSAFAGGDRERGLQLYKEGKFIEAQAAFAAAALEDPESAELQWNLALAAWRAGDLGAAELAADKYSALAKDSKDELHRGMLGAIRFAQALEFERQADEAIAAAQGQSMPMDPDADPPAQPLPLLEKALQKALSARGHFVRGARANPKPEILRNTERALRKIDELKKRIEELRQQQQQEQQDGDQNEDNKQPEEGGPEEDQKSDDQQKGDKQQDEKKPDEQKSDEQKSDEQKGEQKSDENQSQKPDGKPDPSQQGDEDPPETPEPKPNPDEQAEQGEPKPGDQKPGEQEPEPDRQDNAGSEEQQPVPPEPKPGESRSDAPGEGGEGLELTPEQAQRLLERAKKLDELLKLAKKRQTSRRRAVERDW